MDNTDKLINQNVKLICAIEITRNQISDTKNEIKQLLTDVKIRALELDDIDAENRYNKDIMHSISFGTEEYIGLVSRLSNLEEKLDTLKAIMLEDK